MNKEIKEIYDQLPTWKREDNFSPAIRNLIETNTPLDETLRKKFEELHLEIGGNLRKLLETKSVEEKIISQKIILSALKKKDLIDQEQLEENNQWIDVKYLGKGRGIVPRRTIDMSEK